MHPVETYLRAIRDNRTAGVRETSHYPALAALLDAAGAGGRLRPRVRCISHPASTGAGIPDFGLFTADQFGRGEDAPLRGQAPARGVVEAKGTAEDVVKVARDRQVARYAAHYGQVLVTTLHGWQLVERGPGGVVLSERFRMAETEEEFWEKARDPRAFAEEVGDRLVEFLQRVMLRPAALAEPRDVAWLLAGYARDARFRVERGGDLAALAAVRGAMEEALGVSFKGERGEHFFRSTLVQTLFYGVFSAWTLWAREGGTGLFNWREAVWHLRVPVISELFNVIAAPNRLKPLKLVEVLDWAGDALNRVDREAFFTRFGQEHAVQYFYEPFLEAFDPELRKDLGVWYTPPEVVKYMVQRVDTALREELGIDDGLADPRVLVLDPCCGTGAFLVEVLEHIARTLRERGEDSLLGMDVAKAAAERVLGFEILPAPFVVAHLQLGLLLNRLGAKEDEEGAKRRVGVFLTNALTGWEPADEQKVLAMPELAAERDAADHVKRDPRILVVIGNPPYNGYPGLAMGEERGLVEAYRSTKRAPKPQGQGLNDLYVRFFRMAERRIVEMTGKGIVCFISNYSWLDGLSFTGMRERYLEVFDRIWIDSLNGDKFRTGKLTPEGEPDPSIFSTEWNREGIQVGTAVALLTRTGPHTEAPSLEFRNFWGREKRQNLLDNAGLYAAVEPISALGFTFAPVAAQAGYFDWASLPELLPSWFAGVTTARDNELVDIDRDSLFQRMEAYFNPALSNEEIGRSAPGLMQTIGRFDAPKVRAYLLKRGFLRNNIVRYCYRPFDYRWLYWEPETKLLDERRSEYFPHVVRGNHWIEARQKQTKTEFDRGYVTQVLADNFGNGRSSFFPLYLQRAEQSGSLFDAPSDSSLEPNLSGQAVDYVSSIDGNVEDLFFHTVLVLHTPTYRAENAGALRQDWPRIPLPADAVHLRASAELGRTLAALLDPEQPVPGVSSGALRAEMKVLGNITRRDGGQMSEGDFALTAGWGHAGKGGATMPGRGRVNERPWTDAERAAVEAGAVALGLDPAQAVALLGDTVLDVYLNERAFWRCVPRRVWDYTLGGYQVVKKWLSYREQPLLGRALTVDEVREVTAMIRRVTAILLLEPALDGAYAAVKAAPYAWPAAPAAPADQPSLF